MMDGYAINMSPLLLKLDFLLSLYCCLYQGLHRIRLGNVVNSPPKPARRSCMKEEASRSLFVYNRKPPGGDRRQHAQDLRKKSRNKTLQTLIPTGHRVASPSLWSRLLMPLLFT